MAVAIKNKAISASNEVEVEVEAELGNMTSPVLYQNMYQEKIIIGQQKIY